MFLLWICSTYITKSVSVEENSLWEPKGEGGSLSQSGKTKFKSVLEEVSTFSVGQVQEVRNFGLT